MSACSFFIPSGKKHDMKFKSLLVIGFVMLSIASGCGITTNERPVSTATPCAPGQTSVSGQSVPVTPMPNQPTFSPEMLATAEARLKQANPGGPTTSSQVISPLPPCPTNTPLPTLQPQTPQGGSVQATPAPSLLAFSQE